jgi:hypothetical protein
VIRVASPYGRAHRRLRAQWSPQVATGHVTCWRCRELIGAREPWDLGHDDDAPGTYRGPEHTTCNRATRTAGRATAADGGDPAPMVRRWWT